MLLIVGASGTVGSRLTRRLLERGDSVRAVSRNARHLESLRSLGATAIEGDLRSESWMKSALDGVSTLVLAAHGLVPPSRQNHPGVVDGEGSRRMIDVAQRARVGHIVFVSASSGAGSPTLFGRVKYQTEQHLERCGVDYTIVRPTVYTETHALQLLAKPLREQGSVVLLGSGTTRVNWISADDVVTYILQAIGSGQPRNRTSVIGGPDTMSRLEVLASIERMLGVTARRRHVPLALLKGIKSLAGPFHPGIRYLLDMVVVESTQPNDDMWAPRALDWTGSTTVADVIERWMREST